MAKITIDGLAGTGKSTATKMLAEKLGYQFSSSGDFIRMQAKELGLSIHQFDDLARTDSKYDITRDKMVEKYGKIHNDFIVEGRLGWKFIPDAHKVKLHCDFDARVRRAADRDGLDFETAKRHTIQREEAIADRFFRYYGIENAIDDSHFDLIIDTTNTKKGEAMEIICRHFNLK